MFGGPWFEAVLVADRPRLIANLESRLRPGLWCDGAWWADYHRLRVIAVRS
jgi:hypothetical protein